MDSKEYTEIKDLLHKQDLKLTRIEAKVDDYKEFKKTASEALSLSKENDKEIEEIKDKIRWLSRTIAGAIITGLIGLIFIFIKIGMGGI